MIPILLKNSISLIISKADVCNLWQYRGLFLTGKILTFNTLALSKLVYTCTVKIPSKNVADLLNSIHKNFIWSNKKPKIKHSTLIADYKEGGYKDVDMKSKILSLNVSWISELVDTNFCCGKLYQTKYFLWSVEQRLFFASILTLPPPQGRVE